MTAGSVLVVGIGAAPTSRPDGLHGMEGASDARDVFEGRDRKTGKIKSTGTRVDLNFGSNSQLRAWAEVHASADAQQRFVLDFAAAWNKVMNLDRF